MASHFGIFGHRHIIFMYFITSLTLPFLSTILTLKTMLSMTKVALILFFLPVFFVICSQNLQLCLKIRIHTQNNNNYSLKQTNKTKNGSRTLNLISKTVRFIFANVYKPQLLRSSGRVVSCFVVQLVLKNSLISFSLLHIGECDQKNPVAFTGQVQFNKQI